ncbi:SGNH/GDSL hydrolase family protein [Providencia stuartii]|uniref:SGNH/GDSL hydrolase family protein n=1 Tax=Providencia TaxID=586 RepID=UPI0027F73393|nr:SGNH/GDSL hydrolase family protein [Providencia sp. 2023EL-00965]ELR5038255.1 SGNH/GDSL hydrolase family protein [Providencia stuartii]ELR5082148.1 SGNH/GDSL hydrolase family protein [Providencia stuartii]ELR5301151.1 SGNH/GDSL hydrolase family protein [Providencia stuartii]MDW7589350.1 SGNH/GDSL hydrolase family protein [Providencia sp. 2023EL-00965]
MKRNKLRQARSKVAAASVIALLSLGLLSCQQGVERTQKSSTRMLAEADVQGQLINNAEPNLSRLDNKLKQGNQQIHIVQIGDSHTAADFFSGELRTLFQQRYGDAGPGFVPAISVPGQRTATINRKSDKQQWELFSSRKDERFDYPLGGLVALPMKPTSRVQLVPLQAAAGTYQLQALYQNSSGGQMFVSPASSSPISLPTTGNTWRFSTPVSTQLPAEVTVSNDSNLKLGGWLLRSNHPGVTLSALGINGATINMLDKWQPQWVETLAEMSPDMVILAYGTNEAFNDNLDLVAYQQNLREKIRQIRQRMPESVILLVGPNDSIKFSHAASCEAKMPVHLMNVIKIQKAIAAQENTLFWDWQAFMGGPCSIRSWAAQDLARPDNVHLSAEGYKKSAQALYRQLSQVLN